jgi:uncharacterized phage protein (TIGR02218 family)
VTYDEAERSEQSGAPVELYLFTRNAFDLSTPCVPASSEQPLYRYTSAEAAVQYDGEAWLPEPLLRSSIEVTPEQARLPLEIRTRRDLPVCDLFRVAAPTDVVAVTVYRLHRDESPADAIVLWTGRVLNCAWNGATAVLNCEPVSTSLRRPGLRRLYQKQCPHVLYGPLCGVERAAVSVEATVTAIDGMTVTVAGLDELPYGGGFVEWTTADGALERRFIKEASGSPTDTLLLSRPPTGLEVDDAVTVYPGCDHTMSTCETVFNNLPNYGGFPFIPTKNPFDGTPVY